MPTNETGLAIDTHTLSQSPVNKCNLSFSFIPQVHRLKIWRFTRYTTYNNTNEHGKKYAIKHHSMYNICWAEEKKQSKDESNERERIFCWLLCVACCFAFAMLCNLCLTLIRWQRHMVFLKAFLSEIIYERRERKESVECYTFTKWHYKVRGLPNTSTYRTANRNKSTIENDRYAFYTHTFHAHDYCVDSNELKHHRP